MPTLEAPADWYADEPVYVGNEMPVEEARAWAQRRPGFEEVWIDRDHNGWVSLAFSKDAEAAQADLETAFPDGGVVVVPVGYSYAGLRELQDRVVERFASEGIGVGVSVTQGVVTIGFGVLTDERLAAVEDAFGDEPVCVEGADPADVPTDGPQPVTGDGWRLLADEAPAGQAYRTGIAWDDASYADLWVRAGVTADAPAVDFDAEVVIWFGAVYGSSCPDLRLDDVIVDHDRALVYADIVLVEPPAACTDDANPHAYLVAVQRAALPAGPFAIQLDADGTPAGVPEERTYVDADLSQPGATAEPDQVRNDDEPAGQQPARSGDVIEVGYPWPYRAFVHCGAEWLGELNGVVWRTAEAVPGQEFLPQPWRDLVNDDQLDLEVTIREGDPPTLTAVANGHEVTYVPTDDPQPPCD